MATRRLRLSARLGCWAALAALWAPAAAAQPVSPDPPYTCVRELNAAEDEYVRGAYREAERLTLRCLQEEALMDGVYPRAYRLLVLVRLRMDDRESARQAAVRLVNAAPGYLPDPVQDPPDYVDFVEGVRAELRAEGRLPEAPGTPRWEQRRTWLIVGGGLLLVGLFALAGGN